jgi:hypothetical protein
VGWVTGNSKDIPHSHLMGTDEFCLQSYHVAVSARKVRNALHGCLLMHELGDCDGAHAKSRAGAITDVNGVDAVLLKIAGTFNNARHIKSTRHV